MAKREGWAVRFSRIPLFWRCSIISAHFTREARPVIEVGFGISCRPLGRISPRGINYFAQVAAPGKVMGIESGSRGPFRTPYELIRDLPG